MSDQKPALKFKANIPEEVTLNFDEPKEGEGEYGKWYLYGCLHKGEERIFFPTELLHKMIQLSGFTEGSKFVILKNEADDGKMFFTVDGKTINEIQEASNQEKLTAPNTEEDIPF